VTTATPQPTPDATCAGNDAGVEVDAAEGATASEGAGGEARDDAAGGAEGEVGGGGEGGAGPLELDTVAIARTREVVRSGTMRLTVDDVDVCASDVRRVATDAGGFVADEQVRERDDEVDVTVRVPAAGSTTCAARSVSWGTSPNRTSRPRT
jgi:hypothetical protein